MKKRLFSFGLLLIGIIFLVSCSKSYDVVGSGDYIEKEYRLSSNINSLVIDNLKVINENEIIPIVVNVFESDEPTLIVRTQENIHEHIKIDQAVNSLNIVGDEGVSFYTKDIEIEVYGCYFNEISCSFCTLNCDLFGNNAVVRLKKASTLTIFHLKNKSFQITLDNYCYLDIRAMDLTSFDATIKDNASIKINRAYCKEFSIQATHGLVKVDDLTTSNSSFELSSNSEVDVSGKSENNSITATTGANFMGKEYKTDTITLVAAGNSFIEIYGINAIFVFDTGAKDIKYYGPAIVTKTIFISK